MSTQQAIEIASDSLTLEGILYQPGQQTGAVVVVCHPHPQSGGEMRNNVVMAVVRALVEGGISALTFNFRGVGKSQGDYDKGIGEQDDVRAALAYAKALPGVQSVGLAGYSFGSGMAAAVVDESVEALALVSPPSARIGEDSQLSAYKGPVLLISGDADHVSSVEALEAASKRAAGECAVMIVPGADHFWWGYEDRLRDFVQHFFVRELAVD